MRKLPLAAALLALAAPAFAQPVLELPHRRSAEADGEPVRAHGHVFISPSGEPFRGGDGLAAWFAGADADHDGALTPAEFQADAARAFRLYDTNGDGVVDGFEIQAYERERAPEIAEISFGGDEGRRRGRRRGEAGGAGREGAARYSLLNEPEPLLAADLDVDGKVTLAEWTRATARRFQALDTANAGRLTLENLRPAPPKR